MRSSSARSKGVAVRSEATQGDSLGGFAVQGDVAGAMERRRMVRRPFAVDFVEAIPLLGSAGTSSPSSDTPPDARVPGATARPTAAWVTQIRSHQAMPSGRPALGVGSALSAAVTALQTSLVVCRPGMAIDDGDGDGDGGEGQDEAP